jgi:hypothetical protein
MGDSDAEGQSETPVKITQMKSPSPLDLAETKHSWKSIESKASTFLCFKCGYANQKGSAECESCGLVFGKSKKPVGTLRESVAALPDLKMAWESVIEDFGSQSRHETFIKIALAHKNLPYASQQYRTILESNPNDEIANKMREKIISIATLTYVPPKREGGVRRNIPFPLIFASAGLLFIVLGLAFQPLRDIIPVAAVFCFVGIAMMIVKRIQY